MSSLAAPTGHHGPPPNYVRKGVLVNRKRVERMMRRRGIIGAHQRRTVHTTIGGPAAAGVPDPIRRDCTATGPDQR
ncbi:hypothetical protein [Paractinoplanes globisporus]|uniref:HTH-like domain-containing protein n=1 Tax=Paractinoplanes globisporus TaxID=113565 RepID=A0ABW6W531_9ACTN|nr:hypothetical protein [Actinoplanes globisporus]